jgi:hypothetical protein
MRIPKNLPSNFTFRIPFHPKVSEKEVDRAAELWVDSERQRSKLQDERAAKAAETVRRRVEKLRTTIGADHYFALDQFKRTLRQEALQKPTSRQVLAKARADLVRNQTRQVKKFLADRKVSSDKVDAAVAQVFESIAFNHFADVAGFPLDGVLTPADPVNPFVTFKPPFTGYGLGYSEGANGFTFEHTTLTDPAAGQVGLIIRMDDGDAGDSDYAFVNRSSTVAFWFQAPRAGLVEVIIDFQCGAARHQLSAEDEWGFSDSSTKQRHTFLMQVIHPNVFEPALNLASEFKHDDDGDGATFDIKPFPAGHLFQTQSMISDGPVPAGANVLIVVGCQSEDESNTNDMEIHSKSTFSWFIPRVQVRIL